MKIKPEDLKDWDKLTKKEQARLKKIHAPRFEQQYNVKGVKSTTAREIKKNG